MTTTKRQRQMSYRSSVTVNFVCATKFCFDPPFFNCSSPRALSAQYSAHHTSRKRQLARFPAHLSSALIRCSMTKLKHRLAFQLLTFTVSCFSLAHLDILHNDELYHKLLLIKLVHKIDFEFMSYPRSNYLKRKL